MCSSVSVCCGARNGKECCTFRIRICEMEVAKVITQLGFWTSDKPASLFDFFCYSTACFDCGQKIALGQHVQSVSAHLFVQCV